MDNWSRPGTGRDLSETVPDPPAAEPAEQDEPAEWDELTPPGGGRVTSANDVLVAGAPLAESAEEPVAAAPETPAAPETAGPPRQQEYGHGGGPTVLATEAADRFQERWRDVQFGFVDDPRTAVRRADELAAEVLEAFTDALSTSKRSLDDHRHDDDLDTERLRIAVRAYREFVDKLLTT
jgi:hypothetical protein